VGVVTPRFLLLSWTVVVPLLAIVALAPTWGRDLGVVLVVAVAVIPAGAVLAAVHHAEVVAHRVGEPFGSLVLAVAVTVIEVALIVTLMVSGGPETASLARDTVFAAVMITTNGIVGISLLLGALRYGVTLFNAEGTGAALATVATLATLSLVLSTFTTSQPGPQFSPAQLTFAAGLAGAVRDVRAHPDRAPPGLLPPRHLGGCRRRGREPCSATDRARGCDESRTAGGGGRRAREGGVPGDRSRSRRPWASRLPSSVW
jgi:hypothetical protein